MNSETTSLLVLTNKTKTGTRVFHSPKLRIRQPKTDPNCWKKAAACSQQMPTIFLFGSNFMMVITNITNSVRFKMIQGHCIQDVENDKPLCDSIGTCRIGTRIFNPHLGTPVFAAYLANCSVGKHYFLLLASFLNLCWSNRHLLPSGIRLHNSGKSQFSMGKSTISMVIFNIAMLVITRGYVKTIQWWNSWVWMLSPKKMSGIINVESKTSTWNQQSKHRIYFGICYIRNFGWRISHPYYIYT